MTGRAARIAATMIRSSCVVLLLLVGGCVSTSDESTAPEPDASNAARAQEDLPAEWKNFSQINSDYFRRTESESPADAEVTDAPRAR